MTQFSNRLGHCTSNVQESADNVHSTTPRSPRLPAIVNTNLDAGLSQRQLSRSQATLAQAVTRLSSGLRVNAASDDAAGLAISDRMNAQIRSLKVAMRNTQDAISRTQTADTGLASIAASLQRLRELAVQAANASNSGGDRAALQAEAAQRIAEIDRIATQTRFNGAALLDGSFGSRGFQVGAGDAADQHIVFGGLSSARASVLGATAPTPPAITTTLASASSLSAASTIDGAGELVINGVDIYQGSTIDADASSIAAAINAAGIGGVGATAAPNSLAGTWSASSAGAEMFSINGVFCGVGLTGNQTNDTNNTVNFFNFILRPYYIPQLSAVANGNGITITMSDGRNILLGSSTGIAGIGLGGVPTGPSEYAPTTSYGSYSVSYTGSAGLSISGSRVAALGLTAMSAPAAPAPDGTSAVGQIDLSRVDGAVAALASVDAALEAVDRQRAALGAVQNRFQAAIANTQANSDNDAAARSRIVDCDYASEMTSLVRSQILQQAGIALLAQANASPNWVLALLK